MPALNQFARLAFAILTVVVLAATAGRVARAEPGKPSDPSSIAAKEQPLGKVRAGYAAGSIAVSSNGRLAYAIGPQGRQQMVIDDKPGETVVFCSIPEFSPGTDGLYYFAIKQAGSGKLNVDLIAAGKTITTDFEPGAGAFAFGADGKHYAAVGGKAIADRKPPKPAGVTVIIDGNTIGTFLDTSIPVFLKDGKSAFVSLNADDTMSLVVDSKVLKSFKKPEVPCSFIYNTSVVGPNLHGMAKLHFLPNGDIACLVRDEKGWSTWLGNKRLASYGLVVWGGPNGNISTLDYDGSDKAPAIMANSFIVADEAPVAAWWSRNGGKGTDWQVVVNGTAADKHSWKSDIQRNPPKMSADGKHLAYAGVLEKTADKSEAYVVHDGNKYGPYQSVWGLSMSPDGMHVAYAARTIGDEKVWHGHVDGKRVGDSFTSLYATRFAPVGTSVAWSANANGKACAVLNGVSVAVADEILSGPLIAGDGQMKWIVKRGDEVVEVIPASH